MNENWYAKLDAEYHYPTNNSDFVIRVVKHGESIEEVADDAAEGGVKKGPKTLPVEVHHFKVLKATVSESSRVFKTMLGPGSKFSEANETSIDIRGVDPTAMKVWFSILHGSATDDEDIDLKVVWEVLTAAHKYEFDPKSSDAMSWFSSWHEAKQRQCGFGFDDYQALLLPCYPFDAAIPFA